MPFLMQIVEVTAAVLCSVSHIITQEHSTGEIHLPSVYTLHKPNTLHSLGYRQLNQKPRYSGKALRLHLMLYSHWPIYNNLHPAHVPE